MDEQNINVSDMYKKYYEKYEKESICLNKNNWNIYKHFNFLVQGIHLLQFIDSIGCREFDYNDYKKTDDCKIIIESIYILIKFKLFIKRLKLGIKMWNHMHDNIKLSIDDIKEKAIIDVLEKEILFMENRIKFKLWFLK